MGGHCAPRAVRARPHAGPATCNQALTRSSSSRRWPPKSVACPDRPRWATDKEREMKGRQWVRAAWLVLALFGVVPAARAAADEAPDALIRRVSAAGVDAAKASGADAGATPRLMAPVAAKIM